MIVDLDQAQQRLKLLDQLIAAKEHSLTTTVTEMSASNGDLMLFGNLSTQLTHLQGEIAESRQFLDQSSILSHSINREIASLEHRKNNATRTADLFKDITALHQSLAQVREADDIELASHSLGKCISLVNLLKPRLDCD